MIVYTWFIFYSKSWFIIKPGKGYKASSISGGVINEGIL
jgi:hypothetical protein